MKITHRRLITFALLLSNIMAGMDGTIVNTALPAITSDLHGLQYTGWIVATFLFGMSVATPFWSKLGEHKGNRWAYVAATTLFALGAILQAQAPSIIWFIAARTVMGIGAGGMNTIPFIPKFKATLTSCRLGQCLFWDGLDRGALAGRVDC